MKIFRVIAVGLMLAAPVQAQDFDSGMEAYQAGDYAIALQNFLPLAEQGNAWAQNCPSSYKMGHQSGLSIGGSGSFV